MLCLKITADYKSDDDEDDAIIQSIENSANERIVVRLNESFVNYKQIQCLLDPKSYINNNISTYLHI
jgi:hypothetical protein